MKDREHGISDPDKFHPYGKFFVTNGNRELNITLANRNGIELELDEWYTDYATRIVASKETSLGLNRAEVESMVEYMQRWLEMTGEPKLKFTEMVLVNDRWSAQCTYRCSEEQAIKKFERAVKQERELGQVEAVCLINEAGEKVRWEEVERKCGKPLQELTIDELDLHGRNKVDGDHVYDFIYHTDGIEFNIANGHGGHLYSVKVTREWLRDAGYEVTQ